VAGEGLWRVASLSLPDPARLPSDGAAMLSLVQNCSAIELFAGRAMQAQPAFRLSEQNAATVARICLQLEGIPLALELAAARVSALTVEQIADRLSDRFHLLTQGRARRSRGSRPWRRRSSGVSICSKFGTASFCALSRYLLAAGPSKRRSKWSGDRHFERRDS